MVETHLTTLKPELYERLIDRLGLALDAARTAVHLRDEMPAELELRGLSSDEFDLINAYLHANTMGSKDGQPGHVLPPVRRRAKAKVVWLNDKAREKHAAQATGLPFK